MSPHMVVASALVALAVLVDLLCCIGIARARGALARLHFVGPASIVGPLLVAVALFASHASAESCDKALLVWVALCVSGPIVAHAVGRAAAADERDPAVRGF